MLRTTWIKFAISYGIRIGASIRCVSNLARSVSTTSHGEGMREGPPQDKPALQLPTSNKRLSPSTDIAATKDMKTYGSRYSDTCCPGGAASGEDGRA